METNAQNDTRRLENRPQLAKRYGVSTRTVATWQQRGLIPFIRISRTLRFDPREVDEALIRNHRVAARGEVT